MMYDDLCKKLQLMVNSELKETKETITDFTDAHLNHTKTIRVQCIQIKKLLLKPLKLLLTFLRKTLNNFSIIVYH